MRILVLTAPRYVARMVLTCVVWEVYIIEVAVDIDRDNPWTWPEHTRAPSL